MRARRRSSKYRYTAVVHRMTTAMRKNMRALTPPRNRMPMAMVATTMKAPMSGSRISSTPTKATATTIGVTARKNFSRVSMRRTM